MKTKLYQNIQKMNISEKEKKLLYHSLVVISYSQEGLEPFVELMEQDDKLLDKLYQFYIEKKTASKLKDKDAWEQIIEKEKKLLLNIK